MKGKKLLFAVNLILIACLVLSPLTVLAQDEATNPLPAETIVESAPAEDSGGESVTAAPAAEPAAEVQTAGTVEETVTEVKVETPNTDTVEVVETVIETETEKKEETQPNEGTSEEESVAETDETEKLEETTEEKAVAEASEPEIYEETAEQLNTVETAPDTEEVILVDLDLSKGDVRVNDDGEDNERINITGKDAAGNDIDKKVYNGATIRVNQANNTEQTENLISIIFNKAKSFVKVILNSLNIKYNDHQEDEADEEDRYEDEPSVAVQTESKDSTVILQIAGENKVTSTDDNDAAINKSGKGTLVIQGDNKDKDSLEVEYTHSGRGAAIGGGGSDDSVGTIIISSIKVNATTNGKGAAIGAGMNGSVDEIIIGNDSDVTAKSTGRGAGIGGGQYGTVGTITISNSTVAATGTDRGAAIGAGEEGTVENIVIENSSDVTATSTGRGAAIGAGQGDSSDTQEGHVDSIAISDSDVTATGNSNGSAIGGGQYGTVGNISIDNANVSATGIKAVKGEIKDENLTNVTDVKNETKEFSTKAKNSFPDPEAIAIPTAPSAPAPTPTPVPVVVVDPPKEDSSDEEVNPVTPVLPKTDTPAEEKKDALVESKKDDAIVQSNVEITGATAKITVTDNNGEQIEPKEVTIKSVAAFEETGASEASIQLTAKLIVDVDVATMKEAAAQTGSTADVVTVTNEDSVITVKSGGAELVSVDVKAVVEATEETVTVKFGTNTVKVICGAAAYDIDLTGLGDLGTLTLKLENGVLKIYDKDGNLIKEVTRA